MSTPIRPLPLTALWSLVLASAAATAPAWAAGEGGSGLPATADGAALLQRLPAAEAGAGVLGSQGVQGGQGAWTGSRVMLVGTMAGSAGDRPAPAAATPAQAAAVAPAAATISPEPDYVAIGLAGLAVVIGLARRRG